MKPFSPISAEPVESIDSTLSRVEGNDAIAENALLEAREVIARTRVRYQQLSESIEGIKVNLDELEHQAQLWTQRTLELRAGDEKGAFHCREEKRRCRDLIANQRINLSKHEALAATMADRLQNMETRLQCLYSQRTATHTGQSPSEKDKPTPCG